MHYYQFNIGDYAKATRHLSNLEDLAYRRLMELYYDTETPLIKDISKLARLVNMRENQDEVQAVIDDFFFECESGYKQNRIEKEIANYRLKGEIARANGKLGGRPREPRNNPVAFPSEPNTNPAQTGSKANQEPRTSNKEPLTNEKPSGTSAYSEAFERWWKIFPKRGGRVRGKKNAYPLFNRIPKSEYQNLKKATDNYAKEKRIKDPERFLKNDYWKDFIEDAEFEKVETTSSTNSWARGKPTESPAKVHNITPKDTFLLNQG